MRFWSLTEAVARRTKEKLPFARAFVDPFAELDVLLRRQDVGVDCGARTRRPINAGWDCPGGAHIP